MSERTIFLRVKVLEIMLSICGSAVLKLTYYNTLCQARLQTFQKKGEQKGHIPQQLIYQAAGVYRKKLNSSSKK